MSTLHFVDADGNYIGGFGDGAIPPDGAIQVEQAPKHGHDKWDHVNKEWGTLAYDKMIKRERKLAKVFDKMLSEEED